MILTSLLVGAGCGVVVGLLQWIATDLIEGERPFYLIGIEIREWRHRRRQN